MTNPNNSIGTSGAYGGRTSVNAFNDMLQAFKGRGVLTGFAISPGTGMQVNIGGSSLVRDVAIAEDNTGNFATVNNITQAPVALDISTAPSANSRIDAVVAYVTNPPQGVSTVVDNPSACGLLDVAGAVASSPSAPTESAIRAAISSDGGSGSTAYYVILGYVTIASGTTDITADMITAGALASLNIHDGTITTSEIADNSVTSAKINSSSLLGTSVAFRLNDGSTTTYGLHSTGDFAGLNFTSGTASGNATFRAGEWSTGSMGGGLVMSSTLTPGYYLVNWSLASSGGGGTAQANSYTPFRIGVNSTYGMEHGVSQMGGGATFVEIVHLQSGDILNIQVYRGTSYTLSCRNWAVGYLLKAD